MEDVRIIIVEQRLLPYSIRFYFAVHAFDLQALS
jgi:hypothetical protein